MDKIDRTQNTETQILGQKPGQVEGSFEIYSKMIKEVRYEFEVQPEIGFQLFYFFPTKFSPSMFDSADVNGTASILTPAKWQIGNTTLRHCVTGMPTLQALAPAARTR